MARPTRRPVPSKRPAVQPIGLEQARTAASEQPATTTDEGFDPQVAIAQLLQEFDSVLRNEPGVDSETRELIQQQFNDALRDAATATPSAAEAPDRTSFMEALQVLKASGAVAENEADGLIRQIDQALQPLQRRESQLAIEFNRRVRAEGQDKALAWFREASKALSESNQDNDLHLPPPSREASTLLRTEVVNSRSRRLRGPPRRSND